MSMDRNKVYKRSINWASMDSPWLPSAVIRTKGVGKESIYVRLVDRHTNFMTMVKFS